MRRQSRSTERLRLRGQVGMAAPVYVAIVGALAVFSAVLPSAGRGAFWGDLYQPRAMLEVEHYESIRGMALAADAVILGRLIEVEPGREFGEGDDERHHYAAARVEILELLGGAVPASNELVWELPLPPGQGAAEALALNDRLPNEELLLFLRNKATEVLIGGAIGDAEIEAGFYRTVVSGAAFANVGGRVSVPISPIESDFIMGLEGAGFEDLIRVAKGELSEAELLQSTMR